METVWQADKDPQWRVREAAFEDLGQVVVAAPNHAPAMLETLRQAAKDPNEYVQRAALEDVSLQQLLENYWSRPDAILIPYITTRLYHTPLVVGKNTREDHQQGILYTTTVEPPGKWEQPQEVVEHFVHLIQAEARQPEQRFFYQVGKSVWEPLFWRCRC